MERRTFLKAAGLATASSMAGAAVSVQPAPQWQRTARPSDVVVIGAGAFGGWTALRLREMGHSVTLVDAYGPGNARATSGGETRQIRVGYGDREVYSRWVLRGMELWREREREFGLPLLSPAGRLQLATDLNPGLRASRDVFTRLKVDHELMSASDMRRRWPQMEPGEMAVGLYEPGAMIVRAHRACLAVAEAAARKGVQLVAGRAQPDRPTGGTLSQLALQGGGAVSGASYVFACGPWLGRLFPDLLGRKLQTPRREVYFFGTPAGDDRYSCPDLPVFSEASHYGFPSVDGKGIKVCPVGGDTEMDPDNDDRIVTPFQVRRSREYVARRFPGLKDQPIVETRVCQLENSVDEHFIIQRHPGWDNVWIAGGGSGHGFKHGPVVGEYIAERVLGRRTDPALEALFCVKDANF
ncbi:FAD-binding oxidoreductase [Sandarakinorhabdus sp.]|uniref:NAD(P)/FAD-dependent oxidoreductase n=1 Tax=Sandarakinorhabdus sp. TaxID=1916663 RepID=UPI00356541D3